eukprot:1742215-Pyramimonas_sp.AAC.1
MPEQGDEADESGEGEEEQKKEARKYFTLHLRRTSSVPSRCRPRRTRVGAMSNPRRIHVESAS